MNVGGNNTLRETLLRLIAALSINRIGTWMSRNDPVFRHRELTEPCVLQSCRSGCEALRKWHLSEYSREKNCKGTLLRTVP